MQRAAQTSFIYESLFTGNFRRLLKTYLFARYYCIQRIRVLNDYVQVNMQLYRQQRALYYTHLPALGL